VETLKAIHNLEKGKQPNRGRAKKLPDGPVALSKEFLQYYAEIRKLKNRLGSCPKDEKGRINFLRKDASDLNQSRRWKCRRKRLRQCGTTNG
jgi:hypothetical protein